MAIIQDLHDELDQFKDSEFGFGYDLRVDLGNLIIEQMQSLNWTQAQVAQAAGVKASFINRIIHAEANCTFAVAGKILHALCVKPKLMRDERTFMNYSSHPVFVKTGSTNGSEKSPKWTARQEISSSRTKYRHAKAVQL